MKSFFKPLLFIVTIIGFISIAATFPEQQKQEEHFKAKNLKVLPKDISYHELDSIMDDFKAALGVKCDYCHARSKDDPKKLDYASDEKEYKLEAREMMEMTNKINKKYFKSHEGDDNVASMQCITCHRGNHKPTFEMRPPRTKK
jgi:hypothetical protein